MWSFLLACSLSYVYALANVNVDLERKASYQTWCLGECKDITTVSTPGAVLMGGGTDTKEAFAWQISHANGGDFLVLRASGDDAYNEYIMEISIASGHPLNSVTTLLFNSASASAEQEVLDLVTNAEAIFFAGGDQSDYLKYWAGTEVQSIIQSKLSQITVGGTSAGLAILGNYVYSGEKGSVVSEDALANPYDRYPMTPIYIDIRI
jgi:cyanophycinase